MQYVATVEAEIGVRFTDEAVLHLALTIQRERIAADLHIACSAATLQWLQERPI